MDIATILTRKYAGSEWTLDGESYDGLNWLSDSSKPTEDELQSLWSEVQLEIAAETQAKIVAKVSAIAKLQELGLTVDEVEVAFGLKA